MVQRFIVPGIACILLATRLTTKPVHPLASIFQSTLPYLSLQPQPRFVEFMNFLNQHTVQELTDVTRKRGVQINTLEP